MFPDILCPLCHKRHTLTQRWLVWLTTLAQHWTFSRRYLQGLWETLQTKGEDNLRKFCEKGWAYSPFQRNSSLWSKFSKSFFLIKRSKAVASAKIFLVDKRSPCPVNIPSESPFVPRCNFCLHSEPRGQMWHPTREYKAWSFGFILQTSVLLGAVIIATWVCLFQVQSPKWRSAVCLAGCVWLSRDARVNRFPLRPNKAILSKLSHCRCTHFLHSFARESFISATERNNCINALPSGDQWKICWGSNAQSKLMWLLKLWWKCGIICQSQSSSYNVNSFCGKILVCLCEFVPTFKSLAKQPFRISYRLKWSGEKGPNTSHGDCNNQFKFRKNTEQSQSQAVQTSSLPFLVEVTNTNWDSNSTLMLHLLTVLDVWFVAFDYGQIETLKRCDESCEIRFLRVNRTVHWGGTRLAWDFPWALVSLNTARVFGRGFLRNLYHCYVGVVGNTLKVIFCPHRRFHCVRPQRTLSMFTRDLSVPLERHVSK